MTFNRLANIQYSRLKNKVLTDPLQEPTIPIIATAFQPITEEDYLVLGEFLETDLLNGEIAINTTNDRVWVRSDDSIIELNTTTASGFRPLTSNHIWIGESGLAQEYNLGDGFVVGTNSVSVSGMSLTGGNGISIGASNSINLGGDLTQDTIINGLTGSYSMYIGNYGPDTQLNYFSVGVNNGMALYSYDNNQISSGINIGTNVVSIGSNVQNGNVYVTGHTAMMSGYDNRKISLYLFGSGIPTGSGEYFVINGVTFSEGVDFTGQGDPILDTAAIAGLTYSSVPDFISIDYTIGSDSIFFNFSNPAVVSASFSSTTLVENQFNTQLSLNTSGAMLVSGDNGLVINNLGEHRFLDNQTIQKGLQYGGNYDATLVDDSLVPKRYVDNVISTISLTGGNGITIGTASTIDLGGTLNQPTILEGNNQTFDLGTTASPLSFFRVEGIQSTENYKFSGEGLSLTKNPGTFLSDLDYTLSLDSRSFIQQTPNIISSVVNTNSSYEQTQITQSPNQIDILVRINGADDSGFVLNQVTDNFSFVDKRLTPRGLEYQDDYSANFSNRSLVDKEYVDNISGLSFSLINDTTPQLGGNLDLNNFNISGTGSIDIEGNVIADMIQLKGGTGSQGEMTWNTDEETIQLVMDGVTQHIGQDTYIHTRNNTGSIITKGTAVMATGTLGASGRITVAPMISDGSIAGRYFIGLAAEDISAGTDGQVITFGKIRQIDLTDFNDGDVLWLDPTIAGGLTASVPTAPDLKIATAFVIHSASNGTLFVRVENGTDLHNDQRVQISGLTAGQFLGWDDINQRWENKTPSGGSIYTTDGTISSGRVATLTYTLSFSGGRVSFDTTTNGILLPRLTTAQMNAITSPATNLLIFNTDLNGLYRYNGSAWVALSAGYGIIGVYSGSGSGTPTFFSTLQSALETCKASGGYFTIKLYSNITITSAVEIDYTGTGVGNGFLFRQLTIDFNGFSVTNAQANTSDVFTIELSNSASVYQEIRFLNGIVLRTNGTGTHHALKCDTINRFGTIQMYNMLWYCQNNQAARVNLGLSTVVDANTIMDFGGSKFISGGTGRTCTFNNANQTIINFIVRSTSSLDAFYPDTGRYYNFYAENTSSGAAILAVGSNAILSNFNCRSNTGKALDLNGSGMEAHNFTAKSTSGIAVDVKGTATATLFKCDTGNNNALNVEGNSIVKNAFAQNNSATLAAVSTNEVNSLDSVEGINLGASFGGRLQNTTALRGTYTNCKFKSIGGIGAEVISTTNTITLDNCNFESQLDTSSGHALRVQSITSGSFILTKCNFKVRNAGANVITAAAATTIRSRYCTDNEVATTPINANVTIVSSRIIS